MHLGQRAYRFLASGFLLVTLGVPLHLASQARRPDPTQRIAPLLLSSYKLDQSPVCYSPDSCVVVISPDAANPALKLAVWFNLSGVNHVIHPASIDDLSYVHTLAATPTPTGVAVLVYASTTENGPGRWFVLKPDAEPDKSKLRDGYFICMFDVHGNPQRVVPVTTRNIPEKIAYVGEDLFAILLQDHYGAATALSTVSSGGGPVRLVSDDEVQSGDGAQTASSSTASSAGASGPPAKVSGTNMKTPPWEMAYVGSQLVLLRPGIRPFVLTFSPGGSILRVDLKVPPATMAKSIASSDQQWFVRCASTGAAGVNGTLQFDQGNGDLRPPVQMQTNFNRRPIFYFGQGSAYATEADQRQKSVYLVKGN